jgi:hypothetical protein
MKIRTREYMTKTSKEMKFRFIKMLCFSVPKRDPGASVR